MTKISEITYRVFDSDSNLLADRLPLDMLLVFIYGFLSKYDEDELRIVPVDDRLEYTNNSPLSPSETSKQGGVG